MATSQLGLYNKALGHFGERKLATLTESREPRRALDDVYSDVIEYCLGQGFWKFATRSIEIVADTFTVPSFGFNFSYAKPSDWIRTYQVSADPSFMQFLTDYRDENGYWVYNIDPLYVRYISNSTSFGLNLSIWPQAFVEYVAIELADRVAFRITQSENQRETIKKLLKKYKGDALAKDAMNGPVQSLPHGTWVQSRSIRGSSSTSGTV